MEGDDNSLFVFWVEGSLYISANISELQYTIYQGRYEDPKILKS